MSDFTFAIVSNSFISYGFFLTEEYWNKDGHRYYPRQPKLTTIWLKNAIPGNYYSFIVAGYQRKRFEEVVEEKGLKKYEVFRSQIFGNAGHPNNLDHLQMVVFYFPKEWKYAE